MISRNCQKFFLDLMYEFCLAESRLDSSREILWSRIMKPIYYIDIFKLLIRDKEDPQDRWFIDLDDLKIMLEDLEINFKWEELKPICSMVSKTWNKQRITFVDFLNFIIPDLEEEEFVKKQLISRYREELNAETLLTQTFGKGIPKNDDNYEFNSDTFELNLNVVKLDGDDKRSRVVELPKSGTKKKLNTLKRFIFNPLKHIFQEEVKNYRFLKIKSRLISSEGSFKRRAFFRMLDFENNGVISVNNLKQFTVKHAKPIPFSKLKFLYRRMKVALQEKITFKQFMKIFFDCFEKPGGHERHFYNFYYKRENDRRLKVSPSAAKTSMIRGNASTASRKNEKVLLPESPYHKTKLTSRRPLGQPRKRARTLNKVKPKRSRSAFSEYSLESDVDAYSIDSFSSVGREDIRDRQIKERQFAEISRLDSSIESSLNGEGTNRSTVKKSSKIFSTNAKRSLRKRYRIGVISKTRKKNRNLEECMRRLAAFIKYVCISELDLDERRQLVMVHSGERLGKLVKFIIGKSECLSLFTLQNGFADKIGLIAESTELKLVLNRVGSNVRTIKIQHYFWDFLMIDRMEQLLSGSWLV